jgi:hypothetical protein
MYSQGCGGSSPPFGTNTLVFKVKRLFLAVLLFASNNWFRLALAGYVQQPQPNYAPVEISEELLWQTRLLLSINTKHLKINNKWTFQKAPIMRRRFLSDGAYSISWHKGNRKRMERAGPDPIEAEKALLKKSAELSFLAVGGEIKANPADTHVRVEVSEAVEVYLFDGTGKETPGTGLPQEPSKPISIASVI